MKCREIAAAAGVAISLLLGGCRTGDVVCAGIGLVRTVPADVTISVGQSVTLRYQEGGYCAAEPSESDYTDMEVSAWSTVDTTVVQVDSLSGRVTGRMSGDAHVTGRPRFGGFASAVVHVR